MELKYVKGLSDKRIADLNKLGITSAEQLIRHFPRNYLDLTRVAPIRYAFSNEYAFTKARLVSLPQTFISQRRLKCVKGVLEQNGEIFNVSWFNQPYVASRLQPDEEYLFYGRIQNKFGQISLVNPTFEEFADEG